MNVKLNITSTYFDNGTPNMGNEVTSEIIKKNDLFKRLKELSDSNISKGELVVTFPKSDEVFVEIYNGYRE